MSEAGAARVQTASRCGSVCAALPALSKAGVGVSLMESLCDRSAACGSGPTAPGAGFFCGVTCGVGFLPSYLMSQKYPRPALSSPPPPGKQASVLTGLVKRRGSNPSPAVQGHQW
ncbi:hypothetical protein AAFF_G00300400 [Aldrovandia affinis]|uniref:Uncharacterized protein n=1 Tax=Aldrovandia affinis TaxID=143900 RepID=A0AAD7WR84_9TELE|nr:hypothetical protein AAFF_G00300400 [Aldrovandia affinis]